MPETIHIGVDIGGTKIEGIALDAKGQERLRLRIPTPNADYDGLLDTISQFVSKIQKSVKVETTSPQISNWLWHSGHDLSAVE